MAGTLNPLTGSRTSTPITGDSRVETKKIESQELRAPDLGDSGGPSGVTKKTTKTRTFKMPPFDPKQPPDTQVLVGGAGIGGGALARLAEQGFQVKFCEAGPPQRDWFCEVPALHGRSSDDTFTVDGYSPPMALAAYFVEHYEQQQKNVDLKMHEELGGILYPRGQGPGGSGNVNANVAVAPDRSTLEALYHQSGKDPRLHPDQLTKFFARAQDPGPLFAFLETLGHVAMASKKLDATNFARLGEAGWQKITRADPKLLAQDKQLLKIVFHILKFTNDPRNVNLGDILTRFFTLFDSNNDLNHGREGFTLMPISVHKDGRRASVADRLKAVLATRPDTMSIECETKIHSLIFNEKGTRVEGARVMKPHPDVLAQRQRIYDLKIATPDIPADQIVAHNELIAAETEKLRELEATREPQITVERASAGYVLSAGAFEDPMILIRSGYGPKEVLDALGIEPVGGVYHEAVGKNLKDRREITMMYHAKDEFSLLEGLGLGKNPHDDEAMQVWEKSGRGVYATNGVVASYQFKSDPDQPDADIFAFFVPSPFRGYDLGYSTDAEKYPQTFTAILLDKNGNLVSDDSRLMTPKEAEALRGRLGTVAPDPDDPTMMKPSINFNYQRPGPGETPPLYAAMEKMEKLFEGCDVLTQIVPSNPFADLPTDSLAAALDHIQRADLFPTYPDSDFRSTMDWFEKMDLPLYDREGKEHTLSLNREGDPRLSIDGEPATAKRLSELRFHGDVPMTPANLQAQLRREYLMEYQHSQQWGHHANGTTSMGPDQENHVVGSDYRVHGVENLWVVSASATPAAVNPGPFIQLYVAGAIGEVGADALREQLVANESQLAKLSPISVRIPAEISRKNTFGENLLLTIDRSRGHVGESQGELTGEALTALIALHKEQGFSEDDLKLAEEVAQRTVKKRDGNGSVLETLAKELKRLRKDQGFALDLKLRMRALRGAIGAKGDHLTNEEVLDALRALDGPPPEPAKV